jgi:hypothetical protein
MPGLDPSTGILAPLVGFYPIFQYVARRQMLGSGPGMTSRAQRLANMRSAGVPEGPA